MKSWQQISQNNENCVVIPVIHLNYDIGRWYQDKKSSKLPENYVVIPVIHRDCDKWSQYNEISLYIS
jgi:hypothetical protein